MLHGVGSVVRLILDRQKKRSSRSVRGTKETQEGPDTACLFLNPPLKKKRSRTWYRLIPLSCCCLRYLPVNKTLFYDGINSKLFNWHRNIYKQGGRHNFSASTLQIKGKCLILSQQAHFFTNCLETGFQAIRAWKDVSQWTRIFQMLYLEIFISVWDLC